MARRRRNALSPSRLVMLVAWLPLSCVHAKAINGPDTTPHWLIQCPGGQSRCLKEASEKCPEGYEFASPPTTAHTDGSVVERWTEILIKCKSEDESPQEEASGFVKRPAPEGALGYRFRINQMAAENRCAAQGFQAVEHDGRVQCPGLPSSLNLKGQVDLIFCGRDLCEIEVLATFAPEEANDKIAWLQARVSSEYGPPTGVMRRQPPLCAREMLATCLIDGRAEVAEEWVWESGPQIVLEFGESEGKVAAKLTYRQEAGEHLRKPLRADGL